MGFTGGATLLFYINNVSVRWGFSLCELKNFQSNFDAKRRVCVSRYDYTSL